MLNWNGAIDLDTTASVLGGIFFLFIRMQSPFFLFRTAELSSSNYSLAFLYALTPFVILCSVLDMINCSSTCALNSVVVVLRKE